MAEPIKILFRGLARMGPNTNALDEGAHSATWKTQ